MGEKPGLPGRAAGTQQKARVRRVEFCRGNREIVFLRNARSSGREGEGRPNSRNGGSTQADPPFRNLEEELSGGDFFCLQPFRALFHDERDAGALVQRTISARGNGGEVDENVFAILTLNKAESFSRVKPLYCSSFFHVSSISTSDLDCPALSIEHCRGDYQGEHVQRIQTTREDSRTPIV